MGHLKKSGIISFNIEGIHPYDIGVLLDKMGINSRYVHHCTRPIMEDLIFPEPQDFVSNLQHYEEIDVCIASLKAKQMLS